MDQAGRRSAWRFGVPLVCLLAGLLLAATHGVSGGDDIRRSDAPRMVDLVREAQESVDRLSDQRDSLATAIDTHHGGSPGADAALEAITERSTRAWPPTPAWTRSAGPGLDRHAQRRPARRQGPVPARRISRRPGGAPAGHRGRPQRVVERGAEGIQMQDQRIIGTSAPRCVGNTLLLNGRTYSPPYVITAVGNAAAMQAALAAAPLVTLYKQYVVRFGLGYTEEPRAEVELVGHTEPVRMTYAKPAGPVGY